MGRCSRQQATGVLGTPALMGNMRIRKRERVGDQIPHPNLKLETRNSSLLLFVDIRRNSSGPLVVHDLGHFLAVGRDGDLTHAIEFPIAFGGHFNGTVA